MNIRVTLKPNSRHRQEVVAGDDGTFTVYTKEPAIENRANASAIALLAAYFDVPRSRVRLYRGAKAKQKVFEIDAGDS